MDCYDTALRYGHQRVQFDRPIAGFQLATEKLAEMITEITKAQLIRPAPGCTDAMRTKATSATGLYGQDGTAADTAADIVAREARQILGGMGITGEYSVSCATIEPGKRAITYEGTHDMPLLITGMDVTGLTRV